MMAGRGAGRARRNGAPGGRLLYGAAARSALLRGMDRLTALLRPTLGPLPRTVAITRLVGGDVPEILDRGATIARRTIQLADPFEDMGAMLVRAMVGRVDQQVGDGAATAAVIAQALAHEAQRYLAAGYSPVALRRGVERGLAAAREALERQARPADRPELLAGLVLGIVRERRLAEMIGEVIETVGPEGAVLVEDAQATDVTYEYVDGLRWNAGYASPHFVRDGETVARVVNPRILITDAVIERAEQLLPALEACLAAGERRLLVIAPELRDAPLALLLLNRERGVLEQALAVLAPSVGAQRTGILEDLAVATGARCVRTELGDALERVRLEDLGRARQAWASRQAFAILGPQGSRSAIRQRLTELRGALRTADNDPFVLGKLRERIGKLSGAAAAIRVGAPTAGAQEELKTRIEAALQTARLALREGVVPGGGAALLGCLPAVEALGLTGEEAAGGRILAHALTEPMRAILSNAGFEPGALVHEARRRGPPWVFDVLRREWVDAWAVGLVDALAVTRAALEAGASAGAVALTAEALVRRRSLLERLRR